MLACQIYCIRCLASPVVTGHVINKSCQLPFWQYSASKIYCMLYLFSHEVIYPLSTNLANFSYWHPSIFRDTLYVSLVLTCSDLFQTTNHAKFSFWHSYTFRDVLYVLLDQPCIDLSQNHKSCQFSFCNSSTRFVGCLPD